MNINPLNLLHYVLIITMMFAPMRSVLAMQYSHCDMDSDYTMSNSAVSDYSVAHNMTGHEMMAMTVSTGEHKAEYAHDCCTGKSSCASDCDMTVSVSLLLQKTSYTPNFINISGSVALITDLVKKEFTPPFRPPAGYS